MSKRPLALMLGVTGNLSFAAGCLLFSLRRHSPRLEADIFLYTDDTLLPPDEVLLRDLGATPVVYEPPHGAFTQESIRQFSYLSLARFEGFRLLQDYGTVMWLDVDTAIQDDITLLSTYGPLALAQEDPHFTESGVTSPASINGYEPVQGLDPKAPNFNSGVLVLKDSLPDHQDLYQLCLGWLRDYGHQFHYIDQGIMNMLAQRLQRQDPKLVHILPHDNFNAHPRNPAAQHAAIVHAFGAYKLWNDGLTRCCFPEWERDYRRWLAMGGSPWQGPVENAAYLEGGAFYMLRGLFETTSAAQALLEKQQVELTKERALRKRLEQAFASSRPV